MTQFLHAGQTNTDKDPLAFHGGAKSPRRTRPNRGSEPSGWASGSAPRGLGLDLGGRSCPPFAWLFGLPDCCWASLFHGAGCPSCPPPHTRVNSYLLGSSRLAEGGAVAMDTRAGPHWSSVLKAGPTGNHTHSGAPEAILGAGRKR